MIFAPFCGGIPNCGQPPVPVPVDASGVWFFGLWIINWSETLSPTNLLKYSLSAVTILYCRRTFGTWRAGLGAAAALLGFWKAMPFDDLHDTGDALLGIMGGSAGIVLLYQSYLTRKLLRKW